MKTLRQILSFFPEYLILVAVSVVILGDLIVASQFNYLWLIPLIGIIALLILRNKILALSYSLILGLWSFYMLMALFSEYREFPAGAPEGKRMLLVGCSIFLSCLIVAILIPVKYFRDKEK